MRYPTKKVFCVFLLSPALASTLLWLLMVIFNPHPFDFKEFVASLYLWLVFMLFGFLLGFIPALLTGIYAVYFKLHRTVTNLSLVVLIGFLFTALTIASFYVLTNQVIPGYIELGYGLVGALSALFSSLISLPKISADSGH